MKVKEIIFKGRIKPSQFEELNQKPGTGWSSPIQFPQPIRFNGNICTYFNLSSYGAIRLSAGKDGKYHYLGGDTALPEGISKTKSGWIVIPWGENIRLSGCGVSVALYEQNGIVVIDYEVKNAGTGVKYLYRVEWPLREPNIMRCFYYHCETGFNTYLGVAMDPEESIEWPLKENTHYMKKALEFDCSDADVVEPPVEPPIDPPYPIVDWVTVRETPTYRVQEPVNG